ncbi:MAG: 3-deoxy-7-phosphoheptulonate synthase, partial [Henriciella sp.]
MHWITRPDDVPAALLHSANQRRKPFFHTVGTKAGDQRDPAGLVLWVQRLETDELLRLIETLNPKDEAGRITLIARFGSDGVEKGLPPLVRAV